MISHIYISCIFKKRTCNNMFDNKIHSRNKIRKESLPSSQMFYLFLCSIPIYMKNKRREWGEILHLSGSPTKPKVHSALRVS